MIGTSSGPAIAPMSILHYQRVACARWCWLRSSMSQGRLRVVSPIIADCGAALEPVYDLVDAGAIHDPRYIIYE